MGREAIHEILLFGMGLSSIFAHIVSRDTNQRLPVNTWGAIVLVSLSKG